MRSQKLSRVRRVTLKNPAQGPSRERKTSTFGRKVLQNRGLLTYKVTYQVNKCIKDKERSISHCKRKETHKHKKEIN